MAHQTQSTHGHGGSEHGDVQQVVETHHVIEPYVYYRVFAILVVLFILTVAVAFFDLSKMTGWQPANIVIALAIAIAKAAVIILYFMHVKYSSRLTQLFAGSALIFLAIMFAFTFSDYFTRDWIPQGGTWTVPGDSKTTFNR